MRPAVAVILAASVLSFAACASETPRDAGRRADGDEPPPRSGIAGYATATCKQEIVGEPCGPWSGPVRVRLRDGTLVKTFRPGRDGHFRVPLPPRRYIIDPGDHYTVEAGFGRVTVRPGRFTRHRIVYWTGIA